MMFATKGTITFGTEQAETVKQSIGVSKPKVATNSILTEEPKPRGGGSPKRGRSQEVEHLTAKKLSLSPQGINSYAEVLKSLENELMSFQLQRDKVRS